MPDVQDGSVNNAISINDSEAIWLIIHICSGQFRQYI